MKLSTTIARYPRSHILNRAFRYTAAAHTDIRATFKRARRKLARKATPK